MSAQIIGAAWSPTAGTEYEIEVVLDTTGAGIRLFIDGVLWGTIATTFTRSSTAERIYIGSNPTYTPGLGDFADLILFSDVQHTANYTPGYSVEETKYLNATITSPSIPHTGPGTIISFGTFSTSSTGTPRYALEIDGSGDFLYWDGAAWSVSNGTYAQSTDVTTFDTNSSALPVLGASSGKFKIHFPASNSASTVSQYTSTLTENVYNSSGYLITNSPASADELTSLAETVTTSASTSIKYAIVVDGSAKYWDGSAWSTSNGSEAQMNDVSTINSNASTLLGTANSLLQLRVGFFTSDQTVTPSIDEAALTYSFGALATDTPETCIVWGYVNDLSGAAIEDVTVTVKMAESQSEYREAASRVLGYSQAATTDSTGYWQMTLIRSSEFEGAGTYKVTFVKSGVLNIKINNGSDITFTVPDSTSVDISTLIIDQ
jgi:hypothetical protein